ncbi:MAG: hypothetical protein ABH804_00645 [archaeon]
MNFIKKLFDGKKDKMIHLQFQKFSRGEFRNRAMIDAKNSKGNYTIKTSSEFANELVKIAAEKTKNEKTKITGAIISTGDLTGKIDFKDKKQFQGVKKYLIDKEMCGDEILKIIEEFPKAFFALSFEARDVKLKIKPKAPKSGKPGKENENIKVDFCVLKTSDGNLGSSFVFEKPDFKEAKISHVFIINELIVPREEKDFEKIREIAKRKGKIIRHAVIDSEEIISEKEFEA